MQATVPMQLPMLARNVTHFVRLLRNAGMPLAPSRAVDAIEALSHIDIGRRDDVKAALSALLVSHPDERTLFDAAFNVFWRDPDWEGKLRALLLPKVRGGIPAARSNRLADALRAQPSTNLPPAPEPDGERHDIVAPLAFSANEALRTRDFDTLNAAEWRTLQHMIRRRRVHLAQERTRRLKAASRGRHPDLRATARQAVRAGGEWTGWKYRQPVDRTPPLVLLLDISGSMSRYSRAVLYYCHALVQSRERIQAFLFGTRLTNVSRQLRERDPDVAVQAIAELVPDWSGGTRIGAALAEFNRQWARRTLSGRATVLLVTDGLDHEHIELLDTEMARLARFAHRIVWLNPLLRFAGFEPRARGVRAILPHVDVMVPAHHFDSLTALEHELAHARRTRTPRHPTPAPSTAPWN
ncbi:VWA domain-containing protein [Ralstonia sp.]|uniref:vWA domain-containing protein n=1 Tax=Ralstonia sp. TaxID=54061 RepID=UPI0031E12887